MEAHLRSRARPASPEHASKLDSHALARRVADLALEKKAQRVLLLDVRELSSACDWFVITHGTAEVQVKAITDHIANSLEDEGVRAWHIEGRAARRWVLIDFVDVVVHVFHEEARNYYLLEKLWADAPMEEVEGSALPHDEVSFDLVDDDPGDGPADVSEHDDLGQDREEDDLSRSDLDLSGGAERRTQ